jgi:branched-chain amino acid transport system substrate-binding protein
MAIRSKLFLWFVAAILMAPVALVCAAGEATGPAAPYKIGTLNSQTGAFAAIGKAHMDGFLMAVEQINQNGGVNGHPLQLVTYDDESDEMKAVLLLRKLADTDSVHAVWGSTYTGATLALSPVTNELEIPVAFGGGSSAPDAKLGKWGFRVNTTERDEVRAIFAGLQKAGVTRLAVLLQGGGFGLGSWVFIEPEIAKHGFKLTIKETYDPKGVDFTPQLTKIKVSDSDGLLIFGAEMAGGLAVKQSRLIGIKWPMGIPAPLGTPDIKKAVGEFYERDVYLSDFAISVWEQLPDTYRFKEACRGLDQMIQKKYSRSAIMWDAEGTRYAHVLADALKRANPDPSRAKVKEARAQIRDAIEGTKELLTPSGVITFSPTVHSGLYPPARLAVVFKGGRMVLAALPEQ